MGPRKMVEYQLTFVKNGTQKRPVCHVTKPNDKGVVSYNEVVRTDIITAYPIQHPFERNITSSRVNGHEIPDGQRSLVLVKQYRTQITDMRCRDRKTLAEHPRAQLQIECIDSSLNDR
jgi:hypothetical protein